MILVHLTNILGFILLFFFPIGTIIGILLLISTGFIYWLSDKSDESETKKLKKEIGKIQRQNRLENSLDAIEEEYFETGEEALRKRSNCI